MNQNTFRIQRLDMEPSLNKVINSLCCVQEHSRDLVLLDAIKRLPVSESLSPLFDQGL